MSHNVAEEQNDFEAPGSNFPPPLPYGVKFPPQYVTTIVVKFLLSENISESKAQVC